MRGNSSTSAAAAGRPHSKARTAAPAACRNGGLPAGMWASARPVSRPVLDSTAASAVMGDWSYRKSDSARKQPRKKTTPASRRLRNSSVFSAISRVSRVTPA